MSELQMSTGANTVLLKNKKKKKPHRDCSAPEESLSEPLEEDRAQIHFPGEILRRPIFQFWKD